MAMANGMISGKQRVCLDRGKMILAIMRGFIIGIIITYLVYIVLWAFNGEHPNGFLSISVFTSLVSMAVSVYYTIENSSMTSEMKEVTIERVDPLGSAYVLYFVGARHPYLIDFLTDEERDYIRELKPGDSFKFRPYWRKCRIAEIIQ